MADGRVFNYSEDPIIVYHHGALGLVGNVLNNGKMTPDGVVADSIIHVDFKDHAIRGQQYGWKLEPTFRTYVYRIPGVYLFGPVEHDLHCIPSDITRLDPGYSKITRQDRRGVPINTNSGWGVAAPPKGSLDGFNELTWKNFFQIFESRKARFIRSGLHLTVRIQLLKFAGITATEMNHVRTSLKDGLAIWNSAGNPTGSTNPLRFHAELVDELPDAKIQLRKKGVADQNEPNNSAEWWTDIRRGSAAHEFGHLLGLMDEYYVFRRKEKHNKGVTSRVQKLNAEKRDYPGRNRRRSEAGNCPIGHVGNLMQDSTRPVDQTLIDSVYTATNVQKPCFLP